MLSVREWVVCVCWSFSRILEMTEVMWNERMLYIYNKFRTSVFASYACVLSQMSLKTRQLFITYTIGQLFKKKWSCYNKFPENRIPNSHRMERNHPRNLLYGKPGLLSKITTKRELILFSSILLWQTDVSSKKQTPRLTGPWRVLNGSRETKELEIYTIE